ncbi:hypothetical protein HS088_TW23G00165 [Tripterygium wilfordii]|uniref:Uncharacterized protein n=1 Tax=Tripterygium wilfordii TaxID=458696 RepID=A0A7J7BU04_TRIWF|nr:hypothetical protein HS088_TW23G00165 [Tripterygium wilfordii]
MLSKVNTAYENYRDLMVRFYKFVANEEMVCEEAELGAQGFKEKMHGQQKLQEQLHQQMENANFEGEVSVLSSNRFKRLFEGRVSPLFRPR